MNSIDPELLDAYLRTSFEASTPVGRVTIRIGKRSAEVDALLHKNDVSEWAFITAYNPASKELTSEENQKRHTELEADIRESGLFCFQGEGIGDNPEWPPETSLLILGLARDAAIEVGAKYGQNAIVYGRLGQAAELVVLK